MNKISYGLLQYQLEKLHAVMSDLYPMDSASDLDAFLQYLEEVITTSGYTLEEHAELFLTDESAVSFGPMSFDPGLTPPEGMLYC